MTCILRSVLLVPRTIAISKVSIAYLVDEFDDFLGLFTPKVSGDGDPVWAMYQGSNVRDGLDYGHIPRVEALVGSDC